MADRKSRNDTNEFLKTVVYIVLLCCLFISGGYGFAAVYGAINDNSQIEEENVRLQNTISVMEKEKESLHAEIRELETALYKSQNLNFSEITDEDFQCLINDYEEVRYELYNISEELSSIMYRLEYARTEDEKSKVMYDLSVLHDEVYDFAEEAGNALEYYL